MPEDGVVLSWRDKTGEVETILGKADPAVTGHSGLKFTGGECRNMSKNTFRGLCGVPLVGQNKNSAIHGMHVAGVTGDNRGMYILVTKSEVEMAFEKLNAIPGVNITSSKGEFVKQIHGESVLSGQNIHQLSCIHTLPEDSPIQVRGHCGRQITSHTDVKVTLMSEHVTDVLGVPNKWGPPKMRPERYAWETTLDKMQTCSTSFPGELLYRAVCDFQEPLIELCKSDLWHDARPLTETENLSGIVGKKFIDSMNLSASAGFGFKGKKTDWVHQQYDDNTGLYTRYLHEEMREEVDRMENCYRNETRAYPIIVACKKDEVLAKEKCRIFYNSPMALIFLMRKYFLPVVRILQMNSLVSECAVGINAHSQEWEQLDAHINRFEHKIGGDYAAYDIRMNSQVIMAGCSILIDMAKACSYSDEDIHIMRMMCADFVYSNILYDGVILEMWANLMPSGIPITVILDGIGGALNARCYYYSANPDAWKKCERFRKHVSLMTYGDDNAGSKDDECVFTIKGFSEFLAQYGHTYTMPDKHSELRDYLLDDEVEFIKRKSNYIEEIDCTIGALDKDSIHKMLHCYLRGRKSPLSAEQACAQNIDTALLEAFNHGRDFYEDYQTKLRIVAERSGVLHLCDRLEEPFDHRVARWVQQYRNEKSP
jgi:hypothetical protein